MHVNVYTVYLLVVSLSLYCVYSGMNGDFQAESIILTSIYCSNCGRYYKFKLKPGNIIFIITDVPIVLRRRICIGTSYLLHALSL